MPADESLAWWFSGFADGEACFYGGVSGRTLQVSFSVALRADDAQALALGRRLIPYGTIKRREHGYRRPVLSWVISDVEGLLAVVAFFDRYPLRAKKARDYEPWRELVMLKSEHRPGCRVSALRSHPERVAQLVDRLKAGRTYAEVA